MVDRETLINCTNCANCANQWVGQYRCRAGWMQSNIRRLCTDFIDRDQIADQQAERVAVLEWLREEAKMARIRKADMDELTRGYVNALANAIRAIEAGEHHA